MKCFLSDELINAVFSFHFIVYLCVWGAVRGVGRGGAFATYTNSMRTRGQAKSSVLLGDNFIYRRSIKSVATFMFCLEFWSTHSHWHTDTHIPKHTTLYKTYTDAHWEDKKQEMRSEKERRETLSMSEGHWNGMLSLCASVRYIELARSYRYKTHTHSHTETDTGTYCEWYTDVLTSHTEQIRAAELTLRLSISICSRRHVSVSVSVSASLCICVSLS